jgi:hypothetical protein
MLCHVRGMRVTTTSNGQVDHVHQDHWVRFTCDTCRRPAQRLEPCCYADPVQCLPCEQREDADANYYAAMEDARSY